MLSPIETLTRFSRESVTIVSAPLPAWNPNSASDYGQTPDPGVTLQGFPYAPDPNEVLPTGYSAAVVVACTSAPADLNPTVSKVTWRGRTVELLKYTERFWRGRMDGLVLYLGG